MITTMLSSKSLRSRFSKKREGIDKDGRDALFHSSMLNPSKERELADLVMEELRAKANAKEESSVESETKPDVPEDV